MYLLSFTVCNTCTCTVHVQYVYSMCTVCVQYVFVHVSLTVHVICRIARNDGGLKIWQNSVWIPKTCTCTCIACDCPTKIDYQIFQCYGPNISTYYTHSW